MDYEKKKRFIVEFIYGALLLLLLYVFFKYGVNLVSPFILAFLIASVLRKPARALSRTLKIPIKATSLLLVIVFYGTIGTLVALLGIKLFSSLSGFVLQLPSNYNETIEPFLYSVFDGIGQAFYAMDPSLVDAINAMFSQFIQSLGNLITNLSVKAVSAISGGASSLPGFFVKTMLMIISTFFISGDYDTITDFMVRQFPDKWIKFFVRVKQYVVGTLFVCIKSYAIIMTITCVELSIGFMILGIDSAIPIAMGIALFDVLPVLGTGGIMIPWIIIMALQGNYTLAIGLLVLYLIVTVVRNILEPKIVGSQIGLHPLLALMSMFVGAQLFGIVGLFGCPIFMSLIRHLNETGTFNLYK